MSLLSCYFFGGRDENRSFLYGETFRSKYFRSKNKIFIPEVSYFRYVVASGRIFFLPRLSCFRCDFTSGRRKVFKSRVFLNFRSESYIFKPEVTYSQNDVTSGSKVIFSNRKWCISGVASLPVRKLDFQTGSRATANLFLIICRCHYLRCSFSERNGRVKRNRKVSWRTYAIHLQCVRLLIPGVAIERRNGRTNERAGLCDSLCSKGVCSGRRNVAALARC